MEVTYHKTNEEICIGLRNLAVPYVDETAPLHILQYQLASASYAKALCTTPARKYAYKIAATYSSMDEHPSITHAQLGTLIQLLKYCSDKDSAIYSTRD